MALIAVKGLLTAGCQNRKQQWAHTANNNVVCTFSNTKNDKFIYQR